jgi:hypothetical protein
MLKVLCLHRALTLLLASLQPLAAHPQLLTASPSAPAPAAALQVTPTRPPVYFMLLCLSSSLMQVSCQFLQHIHSHSPPLQLHIHLHNHAPSTCSRCSAVTLLRLICRFHVSPLQHIHNSLLSCYRYQHLQLPLQGQRHAVFQWQMQRQLSYLLNCTTWRGLLGSHAANLRGCCIRWVGIYHGWVILVLVFSNTYLINDCTMYFLIKMLRQKLHVCWAAYMALVSSSCSCTSALCLLHPFLPPDFLMRRHTARRH